jgi:ATP-dependent Lon protease
MLEGVTRARIVEYLKTDPFFEVRVEPLVEQAEAGEEAQALIRRVGTEYRAELGTKVPHGMFAELMKLRDPGRLADLITPYLPLRTSDQQVVLEALAPRDRLATVTGFLEAMRAGTLEGEEPEAPKTLHGHTPWWQLATTTLLNQALPAPSEIPTTLPLLAIRDKVYFPRMVFPLFVGREKSVRALKEAETADRLVLLVAQRQVHMDSPQPDDLFPVGAVARVLQMLPLPDGTVRVLLEGIGRARITEYLQTEAFLQVRVEALPETMETGEAAAALVRQVLTDYRAELTTQVPHDHFEQLAMLEEPGRLADLIIPYLPLDIVAQQWFLETASPTERLEGIRRYLEGVRNLLR